jgi:TRAP-type C4-dicarboxylate transport system permease small subunit
MHLAIDLVSPKLEGRKKKMLANIIRFIIIAFAFCVLVIGGFRLIYITHVLGQTSPALQIPMTIVYAAIPLAGILVVYYKLHDFFTPSQTT